MSWTEGGEVVNGLETQLAQGRVVLEGLLIGSDPAAGGAVALARNAGLAVPGGSGCLAVSAWGLRPGFVRVQLPEPGKAAGVKK